MIESVMLALLGGVTGSLLGACATAVWAAWHQWPVVVPLSVTRAGLAGALLVGMAAGVYPSMRAAVLLPTEALGSG
ncbi:ABC transporter permease [Actinoplanes teichomyceticus]|uniref:FtsX-like permease family protein n=1 Tax=Actinoplanes teichomyceticus TaxID=1867 RepID=A0A561WKD5_ACTTI|nr:ABC transporter permease [Actinoplanes teichomyceticus]TWG24332.1 hypothetical protein FHX34_102885 [Actinoplanes teichomyceticus]GIF12817.1 hypothetical protein Ate01nite_28490 [Actinoplanes teichomyceticus]